MIEPISRPCFDTFWYFSGAAEQVPFFTRLSPRLTYSNCQEKI